MCAARLTRRLFLVWLNATDSICEGNGHSLKKTWYCVTLHEGDSIWRGWRYVKEAHIIWQRHRVYEGEIDYMKETHLIWKKRSLYERDARYMKKTHIISRHYMDETHTLTPTHTYTNTHTHTHSYTHTHTLTWYRPTQSISYVPFLVWVFFLQKYFSYRPDFIHFSPAPRCRSQWKKLCAQMLHRRMNSVWTLADCEWREEDMALKRIRLPRAPNV